MVESPDFLRDPVNRRAFLARMSAAGLGVAATALLAGCGGSNSSSGPSSPGGGPGPGLTTFADPKNFPGIPGQSEDVVVLNYALTLETLEADLYRQALNVAAGKPVGDRAPDRRFFLQPASPERRPGHVLALRAGQRRIPLPQAVRGRRSRAPRLPACRNLERGRDTRPG